MNYKKIFLDTCVLSDIGRMKEKDRTMLAFDFVANYKLQIIITLYHIMELEEWKDENLRNNVYNFLESCYVGIGKNYFRLFEEELSGNKNVDIVEYNLSILHYDKNGYLMNFKGFKNSIIASESYKKNKKEHDEICTRLQQLEKTIYDIKSYTRLLMEYDAITKFDIKDFNFSFNDIPGFYTYIYSFTNKIGSSSLKRNYSEMNDVCMSYLAPYMDIIVAERKQVARYNELKNQKDFNRLDNVIIKKHSDVIKYSNNNILFEL